MSTVEIENVAIPFRVVKAAALLPCRDADDPYVAFEKRGPRVFIVGTDGHRLHVIDFPARGDTLEFREIPVPRRMLKEFVRSATEKKECDGWAHLNVKYRKRDDDTDYVIQIELRSEVYAGAKRVMRFRRTHEWPESPPWSRVLPSRHALQTHSESTFNPDYLAHAMRISKVIGHDDRKEPVLASLMSCDSSRSPLLIGTKHAVSGVQVRVTHVIMPVSVPADFSFLSEYLEFCTEAG